MGRYFKTATLNMFDDFYSDPWKDINAKLVEKQTAFDTLSQHKDLLAKQLEQFKVLRDDGIDGELLRRANEYSLNKAQELQDYLIQTGDVDTVTREATNLGKEINGLYTTGDLGAAIQGKIFHDEMLKKNEEMFKGDPGAGDRYKAYWMNEYYKNGGKFAGSTLGGMFELVNLPGIANMEEYAIKVLKESGYKNARKNDDGQWIVETKNGWEGVSKERVESLVANHLFNDPKNKRAIEQRIQMGMDPKVFLAGYENIANYLPYGKGESSSSTEIGDVQKHALKNANDEFYEIRKEERTDKREREKEDRQKNDKLIDKANELYISGDMDGYNRAMALTSSRDNNFRFSEFIVTKDGIKDLGGLTAEFKKPGNETRLKEFGQGIKDKILAQGFDTNTAIQVSNGIVNGHIKSEADLKKFLNTKGVLTSEAQNKNRNYDGGRSGMGRSKQSMVNSAAEGVFDFATNTQSNYNKNRKTTIEGTFTILGTADRANTTYLLRDNPEKFQVYNETRGGYTNLTPELAANIDISKDIDINHYGGIITFTAKDKQGKTVTIQTNNEKATQLLIEQGSRNPNIASIFKRVNYNPSLARFQKLKSDKKIDSKFAPSGLVVKGIGKKEAVYNVVPDPQNPGNHIYSITAGGKIIYSKDEREIAETLEQYLNNK